MHVEFSSTIPDQLYHPPFTNYVTNFLTCILCAFALLLFNVVFNKFSLIQLPLA